MDDGDRVDLDPRVMEASLNLIESAVNLEAMLGPGDPPLVWGRWYVPREEPIFDLCPLPMAMDGMIDLPTVNVPRTPEADDFSLVYDLLNDEDEDGLG